MAKNINISLKNLDIKNILDKICRFWLKSYMIFFILLFLGVAGYGGFVWYRTLYSSGWSEEKINQYINSQDREIKFKEDDFRNIIAEIKKRQENLSTEYQPIKDIFIYSSD